jgi:hypothetical protein
MPEFYLDHLLARTGIDYTLVVRVLRRIRRAAAQALAYARRPWATLRAAPKSEAPPARQMAADR